jgi:tetratricopeptide (TPR) repeat protein
LTGFSYSEKMYRPNHYYLLFCIEFLSSELIYELFIRMNTDRLSLLIQYLDKDPDDAFVNHALGLEYLKRLDKVKALFHFEQVISKHPGQLGTYYHLGNLYAEMGNRDKAIEILKAGIELAKEQKNSRTLSELQFALEQLEDDI